MPVYDTFAKRKQMAQNSGMPVIYRDDILPQGFRVQVAHILGGTIGHNDLLLSASIMHPDTLWQNIDHILSRELGKFTLWESGRSYQDRCIQFLLNHGNIDEVLSLIEIAFQIVDTTIREMQQRVGYNTRSQPSDDAIDELNHRFREHGIGYQYQGGQIIAINSQYLHSEVVEPAISLMHDANFDGALQEFMAAHKHYRERNYRDAIANAGSAFESTMKTICDRRNWSYDPKDTASRLIRVLFGNHLLPPEMESHFTALRSTLESGVPTLRNQAGRGAHGQGSNPVPVPDYLAGYCLHLTATNIVFLVEAHNANPLGCYNLE